MELLISKWLHIISATLLFGTGLGSAFYKWRTDKSGDIHAIAITNRNVVFADWLFTTPTVVLQPLTGIWLANLNGYNLFTPWILLSIILFMIAGACWLPVVYLQIRMRNIAQECLTNHTPLPQLYHQLNKLWFWLGIPAFSAIVVIFALMVGRPS
ncbi:MAG: hypothetical protein AMJ53_00625 [Gammaproteobacteria bacterium SG8_11]|nr:MAG: hypothetical protein AMJ53_00625 [Gammaproteobacteria bacterium SG8_11]